MGPRALTTSAGHRDRPAEDSRYGHDATTRDGARRRGGGGAPGRPPGCWPRPSPPPVPCSTPCSGPDGYAVLDSRTDGTSSPRVPSPSPPRAVRGPLTCRTDGALGFVCHSGVATPPGPGRRKSGHPAPASATPAGPATAAQWRSTRAGRGVGPPPTPRRRRADQDSLRAAAGSVGPRRAARRHARTAYEVEVDTLTSWTRCSPSAPGRVLLTTSRSPTPRRPSEATSSATTGL
jgi:hypothetical protein